MVGEEEGRNRLFPSEEKTSSRPPGLGITHVRPRQARLTDDKTEAQRGRIFIRRSRPTCGWPRETLNNNNIITVTTAVRTQDTFQAGSFLDGCADLHNGPARQQCWDSGFHFSRRGDSGAVRKGSYIKSSHVTSDSVLLGLLFLWTCNK